MGPALRPLSRFLAEDAGGPVLMLNLLRFVPGGEDSYRSYLTGARPIIERLGGSIVHAGPMSTTLIDGDAGRWDAMVLIRWSQRTGLAALVRDGDYQRLNEVRLASLQATTLQASDRWPEFS